MLRSPKQRQILRTQDNGCARRARHWKPCVANCHAAAELLVVERKYQEDRQMLTINSGVSLFGAMAFFGMAAGCATVPAALEQARINYQQVEHDPHVSSQAPVALYEATQSLLRAERTWEQTGDEAEVKHLSYLTNQRVEIARERAQEKVAEAQARLLSEQREAALLEARTREAEQA